MSLFESRVVLDGSQTGDRYFTDGCKFESRVVLDGSQTKLERGLSLIHI